MIAPPLDSWRLHHRGKGSVSTCSTIYLMYFYTISTFCVAFISITDRLQLGRVGRQQGLEKFFWELHFSEHCFHASSFFGKTGFLEVLKASSSPLHPSWCNPSFRKLSDRVNFRAIRRFQKILAILAIAFEFTRLSCMGLCHAKKLTDQHPQHFVDLAGMEWHSPSISHENIHHPNFVHGTSWSTSSAEEKRGETHWHTQDFLLVRDNVLHSKRLVVRPQISFRNRRWSCSSYV